MLAALHRAETGSGSGLERPADAGHETGVVDLDSGRTDTGELETNVVNPISGINIEKPYVKLQTEGIFNPVTVGDCFVQIIQVR